MTAAARSRARRALAAAVLIAVAASIALAQSAAAADPPIVISPDGVTYAATYPGNLFDGVVLVPGSSATRELWVMNTGASGANLAIGLIVVGSASGVFLSALTITTVADASTGSARFDRAGQCASLIRGVHLDPGESVRVDTTLAMANVSGTTAQGALASFNLLVKLTSDEVAAPPACGPDSAPNPPSPTPTPSPTDSAGGGSDGSGTVVVPGVPGDPTATPSPTPSVTPSPSPSLTPTPSPDPGEPDASAVKPNTDRFYQEWFVAAWVVEFVLGGLLAWRALRQDSEGKQ
jgi:hypothetical protein